MGSNPIPGTIFIFLMIPAIITVAVFRLRIRTIGPVPFLYSVTIRA